MKKPRKGPNPVPVEDDILVGKDDICRIFKDPPAASTFYKWVSEGTIAKARRLPHHYRLNQTRANVGLPLVDVREIRSQYESQKKARDAVYRLTWLLFHVVLEWSPGLVNCEPLCPEPEVYFPEDEKTYLAIKRRITGICGPSGDAGVNSDAVLRWEDLLKGADLVAEFITPEDEQPMTPRLKSLIDGSLLGPGPTHYPKVAGEDPGQ